MSADRRAESFPTLNEESPTCPAFQVRLTIREGHRPGASFLVRSFPAVVGRGEDADVRLPDDPDHPTLSRRHLELRLSHGQIQVTDLSTNGTALGEHLLGPGQSAPLGPRALLRLGPSTTVEVESLATIPGASYDPSGPGSTGSDAHAPGLDRSAEREAGAGTHTVPVGPLTTSGDGSEAGGKLGPGAADAGSGSELALSIRVLGPLEVELAGRPIPEPAWEARNAALLLVYLGLHEGRGAAVDQLLEDLWPHTGGGKQALQSAVSRVRRGLRQALGHTIPDPILFERGRYRLNPAYPLGMDALEFHKRKSHVELARTWEEPPARWLPVLERLRALVRGPFCDGFNEEWVLTRRTALTREYLECMSWLGQAYPELGRPGEAQALYQSVLERHPVWEAGHAGLLRLLRDQGARDQAVRHYHEYVRLMKRHLNLGPSPEMLALYQTL